MKRFGRSLGALAFAGGICVFLAGCLSGSPTYFPYLFPGGGAGRSHAKPIGNGYFADFDPNSKRLEVRPEQTTIPIRGSQVVIATIYDAEGKPRRSRRVEWMIEGPGTIVEVDESGYLPDRGVKIDNKYGYSYTDYFEHTITRGNRDPNDDFVIGPGQTWCIITSAVEGQTNLIVYAPEIADWEKNKAYVKLNFVDARLQFPPAASARAGGDFTFSTKINKVADTNPKDFRVRYKILDGPAAALSSTSGGTVDSVMESTTSPGEDGTAKIRINQPFAATGTNRVAIEVIKPNPDDPAKFTVVSRSETKITWQSPEVGVSIDSPKFAPLNQEYLVTYAVASKGGVDTQGITLNATVPEGMELVKTEPRATADGDTLIWTLPGLAAGRQQTVQATYRPIRTGNAVVTADVRTQDGLSARGNKSIEVAEGKLSISLEGPASGVSGEVLPFKLIVTNIGNSPLEKIMVRGRVEEGLETAPNSDVLNESIDYLDAGASKTIPMPVTGKKGGKFQLQAGAIADGNLRAAPQSATVEIREAALTVTAHGLSQAYVGQEVSWELVVRNQGDVPMNNVALKATLPPEISFVSATDGGEGTDKDVVWKVGALPARQERKYTVTGLCEKRIEKATLLAAVRGDPAISGADGSSRTVSLVKPVTGGKPIESSLQILGVPAIQVSIRDSVDPVNVGGRLTYTVKVKNAGTQEATKVDVRMELSSQLKTYRAVGAGANGQVDGQSIRFPVIQTLAPGAEALFTIEADAENPGNARLRVEASSPSIKQPVRAEEPTRILSKAEPYNR